MIAAGVIGWPVAHSKSPLIHRFWLAKLGIDGDYGRFAVHPDRLGEAIRAMPALGLRGVNVTVPHKVAALDDIDSVDGRVREAGALNCLVVEGGSRIYGYNTDVAGIVEALAPIVLDGGHAIVIGAGGAARAAFVALIEIGVGPISVFNRTRASAEAALNATPAVTAGTVCDLEAPLPGDAALVINASPLGMTGQPPLTIDLGPLPLETTVFDMVYAPLETPLLAAARARGMRTIDGLAMLIGQAAAAFELFFDAPAPREHDAELRALLTR